MTFESNTGWADVYLRNTASVVYIADRDRFGDAVVRGPGSEQGTEDISGITFPSRSDAAFESLKRVRPMLHNLTYSSARHAPHWTSG